MAFIPAPEIAKVEVRMTWDDQEVQNNFHVQTAGGWDPTTLLALATAVFNTWQSDLLPLQSNTMALDRVVATDVSAEFGPSVEYSLGSPQPGGNSGASLPNNVTWCVKWPTGLRGRSFRGRTYHIGLTETMAAGNRINSGDATAVLTAYHELWDVLTTDPYVMVVTSYFQAKAPRTIALSTPLIEPVAADYVLDSQRRRLPGRGR